MPILINLRNAKQENPRVKLKALIKSSGLALISGISRRHTVMLPLEACSESDIFDLHAQYRAKNPVRIDLRETSSGLIEATLLGYNGHFPTRVLWQSSAHEYRGPCDFVFSLSDGTVYLGGQKWGAVPMPMPTRRFCWLLTLSSQGKLKRRRMTSHYLPVDHQTNDARYFLGDNYVDHEAQSAGEPAHVMELMKQHQAQGPVLEVGCATGGLLSAFGREGIQSFGMDLSLWAVERAHERLGPGRVWLCNAEADHYPEELLRHAPFGTVVLWAVLEHFHNPFVVLEKLTRFTRSGSTLIINTTNAGSLSHMIFGQDWEGFFDWTHLGVEQVSVETIERELPLIGWQIATLTTHSIWDVSADPTRATLRDWCAADARFRRMLVERGLGDLITCVAVRE
jgi:2-polyprenyl-3-methyl-5-hydroxy-6-metoxy-1,4-benzoquinol methylase